MTKIMADMQKAASPNENHKVLDALVGNWEHSGKAWMMSPDGKMSPEAKPEEFKGTNTNQWILGGRFIEQQVKGQMMGQPFEGIGMIGYDNTKGEYVSVWLDNMNTGLMI